MDDSEYIITVVSPATAAECQRIDSQCMALSQVGLKTLDILKFWVEKAVELVNGDSPEEEKLEIIEYPNRQFPGNPIPDSTHILPDVTIKARARNGEMWNALILFVASDQCDEKSLRSVQHEVLVNGLMRATLAQTDQVILACPTSMTYARYVFTENSQGKTDIKMEMATQELRELTGHMLSVLHGLSEHHPHDDTEMREGMKRFMHLNDDWTMRYS